MDAHIVIEEHICVYVCTQVALSLAESIWSRNRQPEWLQPTVTNSRSQAGLGHGLSCLAGLCSPALSLVVSVSGQLSC